MEYTHVILLCYSCEDLNSCTIPCEIDMIVKDAGDSVIRGDRRYITYPLNDWKTPVYCDHIHEYLQSRKEVTFYHLSYSRTERIYQSVD